MNVSVVDSGLKRQGNCQIEVEKVMARQKVVGNLQVGLDLQHLTRNAAKYYLSQSCQDVAGNKVAIHVRVSEDVQHDEVNLWGELINEVVPIFNRFVPGIDMKVVNPEEDHCGRLCEAKHIEVVWDDGGCYCLGNLLENTAVKVNFECAVRWGDRSYAKSSVIHEFCHALGLDHEHQHVDRDCYLSIAEDEENDQIRAQIGYAITRFDKFSVMNYPNLPFREGGVTVRIPELSSLDKISLNMLWPTAEPPEISPETGLYYCGKEFVVPGVDTNGKCGPDRGPNCPSCRVLKNDHIETHNDEKSVVWQGETGMFYCGREFGSSGVCGPDLGPSCPSCHKLSFGQSWVDYCGKYFGKVAEYHNGVCGPNSGPACPSCCERTGMMSLLPKTLEWRRCTFGDVPLDAVKVPRSKGLYFGRTCEKDPVPGMVRGGDVLFCCVEGMVKEFLTYEVLCNPGKLLLFRWNGQFGDLSTIRTQFDSLTSKDDSNFELIQSGSKYGIGYARVQGFNFPGKVDSCGGVLSCAIWKEERGKVVYEQVDHLYYRVVFVQKIGTSLQVSKLHWI
eukprot:TRINITY_DN286_c0_g1_i1.p1 TRINITY_DN286_c0_g1~~TRINITY_DN286_c0_g1_i1.p1  ORF type:complete len:560 (-),score=87.91 TRINITY_DN286_c0_g1_i1:833-2512(-)